MNLSRPFSNRINQLRVDRSTIRSDFIAGLTLAVESIPDGMASAVLAGVNPIYGLNTLMVATPIGALFTSSVFMNVAMTSAMALVINSTITPLATDVQGQALFTLAVLTGIIMLLLGVFRLGSLIRWVPNSVMTGFMTGVAVLIILCQLPGLTGFDSVFPNKVLATLDLLLNLNEINRETLIVGLLTITLIIAFDRFTKLGGIGLVVAVIVAAIPVHLLGWESVQLVADISSIPRSLPRPQLPDLSLIFILLDSAVALAIIGLVQGAGISQSYPNPDGEYPDTSGDFTGQGVANIAVGIFQGMPAAGSVSGTALITNAGSKSRWANIIAGLLVVVIVLLFASFIEQLVMASLSALLIVAAFRSINFEKIETVWHTNQVSQVAMAITFAATLVMPLHFAVFLGVALSMLLFVVRQSNQVEVKEFIFDEGVFPVEHDAPEELLSNKITFLYIYGSLFYAAASSIEENFPRAEKAKNAVVILGLRGRKDIGSTFLGVLARYDEKLKTGGGKLMLAAVSPDLHEQLERTDLLKTFGEENVFPETERLGEPAQQAYEAARVWLKNKEN